jgi:hypothetical protein
MMPLSNFLSSHKPNVIKFIEEISDAKTTTKTTKSVSFEDYLEDNSNNNTNSSYNENIIEVEFEQAACKYLAMLHRILNSFLPQIKSHIASCSSSTNANQNDDDHDERLLGGEENKDFVSRGDDKSDKNDLSFSQSMQRLVLILEEINAKIV